MRFVSRSRLGALGVAAALLLAVTLIMVASRPSLAWSDVARRIEQVRSVAVTWKTFEIKDGAQILCNTKESYTSDDHGLRTDTFSPDGTLFMSEFALPRRGEWVTIVHHRKDDGGHFERKQMPGPTRDYIGGLTAQSWAAALLGLADGEGARMLDPVVLDGRKAAVFRHGKLTIWVDEESRLPVRIESRGAYLEIYDNFRWDQPLPAAHFDPVIPAGFVDQSMPDPQQNPASWLEHVLKTIREVYAIRYDTRISITRNGVPVYSATGQRFFDAANGVRTETHSHGQLSVLEIYNRKENAWLWISHSTQTYNLVRFKPGEEKAGGWDMTPDRWVEGFASLPGTGMPTQLEAQVIAGRRTLGFEHSAALPAQFGGGQRTDRYWIDETALLPARCEHVVPMANPPGTTEMIEENFVWNPSIDPKLFEIAIPDGYKPLTEDGPPAKPN